MTSNRETGLRRTAEMAAMFMIGDGVLGLLRPAPHVALWQSTFSSVDVLTKPFRGHSARRRLYGCAQIAAGLTLAAVVTRRR